jgi:hypothetical protein
VSEQSEKIRFVLCEPWDKKSPDNNMVFVFDGNPYRADSWHRTIEEAVGYSSLFKNNLKIARVCFFKVETINSQSPHKFLGWVETENKTDTKTPG